MSCDILLETQSHIECHSSVADVGFYVAARNSIYTTSALLNFLIQ